VESLKHGAGSKIPSFDTTAAIPSVVNEELKRLEHKIEVSKTDNSWENRQLGTELNDMDSRQTERIDLLARDIQQHKAEFHRAFETWTSDAQRQIENLHIRLDNTPSITEAHQSSVGASAKMDNKKAVVDTNGSENPGPHFVHKIQQTEYGTQNKGEVDGAFVVFMTFLLSLGLLVFCMICRLVSFDLCFHEIPGSN